MVLFNQNNFDLGLISDKLHNNIDKLNVNTNKISKDHMPISFTGVSSTVDDFVEEKVSSKSIMPVDPDLFDIEPRSKLDDVGHDVFKLKVVEYCSSYEYKKRFKKITLPSIKYKSSKDIPFSLDPRKIRQLLRECHAELLSKVAVYCGASKLMMTNTYRELKEYSVYKKRSSSIRSNDNSVKRARYELSCAINVCKTDNIEVFKANGALKQEENILKIKYYTESLFKGCSTKMSENISTVADEVSSQLHATQSTSKKRDNMSEPLDQAKESDKNVLKTQKKEITFGNNIKQLTLSRRPTRICTATTPRISRLITPEMKETIADSLVSSTIDKNSELANKSVQHESLSDKLKRIRDTFKVENSKKMLAKTKTPLKKNNLRRKMFESTFDLSFLLDAEDDEPKITTTTMSNKDESEDDTINTNDSSGVDESEDGSTITNVSREEEKQIIPAIGDPTTDAESDTGSMQEYHRRRKLKRLLINDSHFNNRRKDHSKRRNACNSIDSDISVQEPSPASSPWPTEAKKSSNIIVDNPNTENHDGDDAFIERFSEIPLESRNITQSVNGDFSSLRRQTVICKLSDKSPCNESTSFYDGISNANQFSNASFKCSSSMPTIDSHESKEIPDEHLENATSPVHTEFTPTEIDKNTELLAVNDQVILNSNDSANAKLSSNHDESSEMLDKKSLRIVDDYLYDKFTEKSLEITVISKAHTTENDSMNEKKTAETSLVNSQLCENNCREKEIIQKAPVGIMGKFMLPSKKRFVRGNMINSSDLLQSSSENLPGNSSSSQVDKCESINSATVSKNQSIVDRMTPTENNEHRSTFSSVSQSLNHYPIGASNSVINDPIEVAKQNTAVVHKLPNSLEYQSSSLQHPRCDSNSSIIVNNQSANIDPTLMTHNLNMNSPKRDTQRVPPPPYPDRPNPITQIYTPMQVQCGTQTQWRNTIPLPPQIIPFQPQNPNFPLNSSTFQQPQPIILNNYPLSMLPFNSPSHSYQTLNNSSSNNTTIVSNPGPSTYPTRSDLPSLPGPSSSSSTAQLPPMNYPIPQSFNQSQLPYNNPIPKQPIPTINQQTTSGSILYESTEGIIYQYLNDIAKNFIIYRGFKFTLNNSPAGSIISQHPESREYLDSECIKLACDVMSTMFRITVMKGHPSIDYTFIYVADRFDRMLKNEFKITYEEMTHMLISYLMMFAPHTIPYMMIPDAVLARKNYSQFEKQKAKNEKKSKHKLALTSSQIQTPQFATQSTSNNGLAGPSSRQMYPSLQPSAPPPLPAPPKDQRKSKLPRLQPKVSMTPSEKAIFEVQVQTYCEISKWIETEINKEHAAILYKQSLIMHEYEKAILAEQRKELQKMHNQLKNSSNISKPVSNVNKEQEPPSSARSPSQNTQNSHAINVMLALNQLSAMAPTINALQKPSKVSSVKRAKKSKAKSSTSCNKMPHEKESKQTEEPQDLISNEKESSQVDEPRDHLIISLLSDANQAAQHHEPISITHDTNDDNINEKQDRSTDAYSNGENEMKSELELKNQDDDTIDLKDEFIKNELVLMSETPCENENHETENMYDDGAGTLADLPNLSIPNLKLERSASNEALDKSNNNSIPELIILDDDSLDYDNNDCVSIISSDRETIVISRDKELDDMMKHNQSLIDEELECEALSKKLGITGPIYAHDNSPIKYDNPVITGVMTIDSNAFETIDENGDILVNDDFIDITDIGLKLERNMISSPNSHCSDKTVIGFIGEDIKNASHRPDCSNCKINKATVACECGEIAYCSDSCLATHWPDFHASICKGAQININTIEEITLDDD